MNAASQEIILQVFRESDEGRLHFGTVVGLLMQAGVESYAVDYRTGHAQPYDRHHRAPEPTTLV